MPTTSATVAGSGDLLWTAGQPIGTTGQILPIEVTLGHVYVPAALAWSATTPEATGETPGGLDALAPFPA